MTLQEMVDILDAEVLVGHNQLGMDIKVAGCADSMADVLVFTTPGMLLLTGMTNTHVINTAYTMGVAAIIIVRGKQPPPETIHLAEALKIPLLTTDYILFEAVGRLYARGLIGCMEKVSKRDDRP